MCWGGRCSSLPFWHGAEDVTSSHPLWPRARCTSCQQARTGRKPCAGPGAWEEEAALVSCHPAPLQALHTPTPTTCILPASYTSDLDWDAVWAQIYHPMLPGRGRPVQMVALNHYAQWATWWQEGASQVQGKTCKGHSQACEPSLSPCSQLGPIPPPSHECGSAFG